MMLGIGQFLWRLIPANPILLRVVEMGGKRKRDLFIRSGYLGLLILWVLLLLAQKSTAMGGGLTDLAKMSASLFQQISYLQLTLVAMLAPIFTAGAITQEKDSQTYDILLATPLTNGQIVLGSLLSRLFFIIALLISGIPIFSITQIFGGVAIQSIVLSFAIAAATAFVTGALAMAIATFKVGTRRTIFSFYLFVAIYLIGLFLLDQVPYFWIKGQTSIGHETSHVSWFTGIHPFLSLRTIFNDADYMPPLLGQLPANLQSWPIGWYLTNPASFYISFMFFLSMLLVIPSMIWLRRVAQSTLSLQGWILQKLKLSTGDRTRKPRYVWQNPIAWREAKTKASAARASFLRYGFIAAGLIWAAVLVFMYSSTEAVGRYVDRNSYNGDQHTLSIYTEDRAETKLVNDDTLVTLDGKNTSMEALSARAAVADYTLDPRDKRVIASMTLKSVPRRIAATEARRFLLGAIIIELAVILLIVTNAAASTVTREKEDGTLDLLLATPITSRYYIWGKLRGLVSFVLPLIAVPIASLLVFVLYDIYRRIESGAFGFQWIVLPESILILPGTMVIITAVAAMIGMQMSLRCRRTIFAVMSSVGIVMGICFAFGSCGFALLSSAGRDPEVQIAMGSASPFTVLAMLVDPYTYLETAAQDEGRLAGMRIVIFMSSWVATGLYAFIVWTMYKSMVKNFDMTIRKQAR